MNNADLTDDLIKKNSVDYVKKNENYEFYKIIDCCAAAARKCSMIFVTTENIIKTKTKINDINQNNSINEHSLTEKEEQNSPMNHLQQCF